MTIAKVNGINLNYRIDGNGDPLVMIMGFQITHSGWMRQTPFFKKYFQVITFDNRGVGKSDVPEGPYTTRMMADDTIGLMNHLNINKAHILDISMGGMIAQELAINYPERVCKLVLGGTYACNDKPGGNTTECTEAMKLPIRKSGDAVIQLCFNRPFSRVFFIPLMRILGKRNKEAGLLGQRESILKHNCLERLPLIKAPTLVIVGSEDRVIRPESSEILAKKIPDARVIKVANGSHVLFNEMSGIFNKEVLNFLSKK